jgi:hypothetical protein
VAQRIFTPPTPKRPRLLLFAVPQRKGTLPIRDLVNSPLCCDLGHNSVRELPSDIWFTSVEADGDLPGWQAQVTRAEAEITRPVRSDIHVRVSDRYVCVADASQLSFCRTTSVRKRHPISLRYLIH